MLLEEPLRMEENEEQEHHREQEKQGIIFLFEDPLEVIREEIVISANSVE